MTREEELEMMERLDLGEDYLDVASEIAGRKLAEKMKAIAEAPETDQAGDLERDRDLGCFMAKEINRRYEDSGRMGGGGDPDGLLV